MNNWLFRKKYINISSNLILVFNMGLENKKIEVELTEEYFKKTIYWIICKYNMDEFKREQSSSKQALLGGFIDRWMNKAPEFLIFSKLLEDKNYDVVTDTFFYTKGESKNAPDIIGLVDKQGVYYPFAKFNTDKWQLIENTPFIEMKTFRSNQSLVTIPYTQFDENHFYVIVESHLEEGYLSAIFDDELFENNEYYEFISSSHDDFIISNEEGIIKNPVKLEKNNELGSYYLLGIYKGKDLKNYSQVVEQGDKPIYFREETESPSRLQKRFKVDSTEIPSGLYYFDNDDKNIPCDIKIYQDSKLTIEYKTKKTLDVNVEGRVEVDGKRLSAGLRRLKFDEFEKNGQIKEVVLTKSILECFNNEISYTDELISIFDDIVGDI